MSRVCVDAALRRGLARSLIFTRLYWSAVALVTTKPFWSVASAKSRATRPFDARAVWSFVVVSARSVVGLAGAADHELERGRDVLGEYVDLAGFERREHDHVPFGPHGTGQRPPEGSACHLVATAPVDDAAAAQRCGNQQRERGTYR